MDDLVWTGVRFSAPPPCTGTASIPRVLAVFSFVQLSFPVTLEDFIRGNQEYDGVPGRRRALGELGANFSRTKVSFCARNRSFR